MGKLSDIQTYYMCIVDKKYFVHVTLGKIQYMLQVYVFFKYIHLLVVTMERSDFWDNACFNIKLNNERPHTQIQLLLFNSFICLP